MSRMNLGGIWKKVHDLNPLIHCITNYVTAGDCANLLLAAGASPIMADNPREAEQIVEKSRCLVLNMGTLRDSAFSAMLTAGRKANRLGIPVILDPVGVGASDYRRACCQELLRTVSFSVIRGNYSEILSLVHWEPGAPGVDTRQEDMHNVLLSADLLSRQTDAVISVSGAVDILTCKDKTCFVYNGSPQMGRITGSGCMLTALTGACCGAAPQDPFISAVTAVCALGLSGEKAQEKMEKDGTGLSSFRTYLIDFISLMSPEILEGGARYVLQ